MLWPRRREPTIRTARAADIGAVSRLLSVTWHDTYDAFLGRERVEEITRAWHSPESLQAQLDQPGTVFLVAEWRGRIAGTVFAHLVRPGEAQIGRLYVHSSSQRHGLGARLLAAAIAHYPQAERIALEVEPRNARAIRFYERHGFAGVGGTAHCGGEETGIPALVMVRRVRRMP